jgi:formiminoglutamate deiminase
VTIYFATYAWLPTGLAADVRLTVEAGRFTEVTANVTPESGDIRLPGLVLPGFANTHSHAFHRALRGRTHDEGGTFWTWRERMYYVAAKLEPDSYLALAKATYAEMAMAGITSVGEFHYLHHASDGSRYADPNAMGHALIEAAKEAGLRITLLDTCYLAGGIGKPLKGTQLRFGDGAAEDWAERAGELKENDQAKIGAAIHSVRAVPRDQLAAVGADQARPLHVHLSEQLAENDQCQAEYGMSPTALLNEAGALSGRTTAVHATHLSDPDIATLAMTHTNISMCPTTERDLADGIGPARRLADTGAPITLGSDQNAVIDLLEEARGLEMDERLSSQKRGQFTPAELVDILTANGHRALGWTDVGTLATGQRADLVAVRLDSVRTAGSDPAQAILAATAADIDTVMVDGRVIVAGGRHERIDTARALADAIEPLWSRR